MNSPICIITGSTLGSAEYLAEYCQEIFTERGITTMLFHGPKWDEVKEYSNWLIITSTHGAGDIPDNLQYLFNEIEKDKLILSDMHFAIAGLGNSDYDTYCYAVDKIESILIKQKANQFYPSFKIDVLNSDDHELAITPWLDEIINKIDCG